MTNKEYWYWICNIHGIGNRGIEVLLAHYGTPEEVYHCSEKELSLIPEIGEKKAHAIASGRKKEMIQKSYQEMEKKGIRFLIRPEEEFPEKLRKIKNPPWCLYCKGKLPDVRVPVLSVVGARECSEYGRETASYFSEILAQYGVQIVSGMARGIDYAAHKGALRAKGMTFAVLGSGPDVCYPPEFYRLYTEIGQCGGIMSEYPCNSKPFPGCFPLRNRLIAGLSDAVLVVEAKKRSGSLITAEIALNEGKDIFALPGRVGDVLSEGCNELIKQGAGLVQKPQDILDAFTVSYSHLANFFQNVTKKENFILETEEKMVYASLGLQPKHINSIVEETKLPVRVVLECLYNMEKSGWIRAGSQNYYMKQIKKTD